MTESQLLALNCAIIAANLMLVGFNFLLARKIARSIERQKSMNDQLLATIALLEHYDAEVQKSIALRATTSDVSPGRPGSGGTILQPDDRDSERA